MEEGDTGAVNYDEVRRKLRAGLQKVKQNLQVIAGTPTTVIPKIKSILSVLRPGVFIMFSIQGPVGNDDRRTSMRLFAQDVMPALKEHAKAIDLPDPFQRTPGSVKLDVGSYARSGFRSRAARELGIEIKEGRVAMFKIGKIFHLTHVVKDLAAVDRWYRRNFCRQSLLSRLRKTGRARRLAGAHRRPRDGARDAGRRA